MEENESFHRTLEHAMKLWFEPEIILRQEAGLIEKPYHLRAAQVILFSDGRRNKIRLNDEVAIIGKIKIKKGVSKKKGDPIYLDEIDGIEDFKLPDSEDPNGGHFTVLKMGNTWYGYFDFRYNKGYAKNLISASAEFLDAAYESFSKGRTRAAIDNLFSAAELAAKAFVITIPYPSERGKKTHGIIHTKFNQLSRHGNVETEQRKAFNKLTNLRSSARYLEKSLNISKDELEDLFLQIKYLLNSVKSRVL
jgi:uncharacterized protein (UPF0332 family)